YARADLLEDEVARYLEQEVAPEERARRHAVGGRVKADVLIHGERGEAHVDAVEIAKEITGEHKRQHAQVDFAHGPLLDRAVRKYRRIHGFSPQGHVGGAGISRVRSGGLPTRRL